MLEVVILALALSMDAFAVSIGLGSKPVESHKKLAIWAAVYFGLFQGLMPLIGYLGGKGLLGWIDVYAPWIAFLLLLFVGGKMIFEAFAEGIEEDVCQITQRVMLTLAIATSIDAMAAGFALNLLQANPFIACVIIGVITMVMSTLGVFIGKRSGTWLESKAELLGGVILILIGIKLVLS